MSTSITFGDEELTAVAMTYNEQLENMYDRDYPVTDDWLASDKPLKGGRQIIIPWSVNEHSTPTIIRTGYERYNDAWQPTLKSGTQTPAFTVQPVLMSLVDETIYSGPGEQVDVLEDRIAAVRIAIRRSIQQFVMRGAASSGSWAGLAAYADWPTLNGIDNSTGFIEAASSGTNTVHGVSKASYPATTHVGFHPFYFDANNAAGTNLLNNMYQLAIRHRIRGYGPLGSANKWYIGENPALFLKQSLRTLERYIDTNKLDDGARMALTFCGAPLEPIGDMPTNGASSTASPMSALLTNWKRGIYARLYPEWKFKMRPFQEVPGTVGVRAALFLLGGTMVAPRAGLWGIVENAETY